MPISASVKDLTLNIDAYQRYKITYLFKEPSNRRDVPSENLIIDETDNLKFNDSESIVGYKKRTT